MYHCKHESILHVSSLFLHVESTSWYRYLVHVDLDLASRASLNSASRSIQNFHVSSQKDSQQVSLLLACL